MLELPEVEEDKYAQSLVQPHHAGCKLQNTNLISSMVPVDLLNCLFVFALISAKYLQSIMWSNDDLR